MPLFNEVLIFGGLKGRGEEHEPLVQLKNKALLSLRYGISMINRTGLGNFA